MALCLGPRLHVLIRLAPTGGLASCQMLCTWDSDLIRIINPMSGSGYRLHPIWIVISPLITLYPNQPAVIMGSDSSEFDTSISASSNSASSSSDGINRTQERLGFICLNVARMPSTIFMLTFFVPYLTLLAKHAVNDTGSVSLLFISLKPSSVPTVAIMIASLLSAIFFPALGALADFSPHRLSLLRGFACCCGLMFCLVATVVRVTWGIGFILLIVMFFAGQAADFLSNSYLAEIADTPGERSNVSASALRFGLSAQVTLLLLGIAASYYFAPFPLQPNGSQFERSNSKGFASIRATSFNTSEALTTLTHRSTIENDWHKVLGDTSGPVKKIIDTKYCVVSSSRLLVNDSDSGSHFVAFSENGEGAQMHNRKITINAVARPEQDNSKACIRVHMLTFDKNGQNAKRVSCPEFEGFPGKKAEHAFRLEATLQDDAHFLYYIVEIKGGAVSITRLDVMDEVLYIAPALCLISGLWYLVWAIFGLRHLGERNSRHSQSHSLSRLILKSVVGLGKTLKRTASDSVLTRSLLAVAFYSASVGSTMLMGPVFITEKLEISQFKIGLTTLGTIISTIIGAILFISLGKRAGYNRALALAYLLWLVDMVLMFFLLHDREQANWLFLTVPMMGIASGGSLALARAVFASQIPLGSECELFGLFSFSQSFMGPFALFLFMAANEILGDLQWGIASQTIFMLLAFALQISIKEEDIESRGASKSNPSSTASSSDQDVIDIE